MRFRNRMKEFNKFLVNFFSIRADTFQTNIDVHVLEIGKLFTFVVNIYLSIYVHTIDLAKLYSNKARFGSCAV